MAWRKYKKELRIMKKLNVYIVKQKNYGEMKKCFTKC